MPKLRKIEKSRSDYSPLGQIFIKESKEQQEEDNIYRLLKRLKNIKEKNEEQLKAIKDQGGKQIEAIKHLIEKDSLSSNKQKNYKFLMETMNTIENLHNIIYFKILIYHYKGTTADVRFNNFIDVAPLFDGTKSNELNLAFAEENAINKYYATITMQRDDSFFDYACNAWYPNINKKLKTRLQAAQNKCIRFCLKLDDRFRLKSKDFERINWLPVCM